MNNPQHHSVSNAPYEPANGSGHHRNYMNDFQHRAASNDPHFGGFPISFFRGALEPSRSGHPHHAVSKESSGPHYGGIPVNFFQSAPSGSGHPHHAISKESSGPHYGGFPESFFRGALQPSPESSSDSSPYPGPEHH